MALPNSMELAGGYYIYERNYNSNWNYVTFGTTSTRLEWICNPHHLNVKKSKMKIRKNRICLHNLNTRILA